MLTQQSIILLDADPVIVGGAANEGAVAETNAGTAEGTVAPAKSESPYPGGGFMWIGIWIVFIGIMYFLMIRPNRKREKAVREMQASIGVGDNIVTSSGLYGVITSVGEDCFVVEFGTNKGIRVPVRKSDVMGIKTPNINPANKEIATTTTEK